MGFDKSTERGTPTGRSYGEACAAAHALDLLGERWALLVVRELTPGPRRFTDLRRGLPGISANILTQRLEGLENIGVLRRTVRPAPSGTPVYELTPFGLEAEPILRALGRWGARSPSHDPALALSPAALVLSLRTRFDSKRGEGFKKRIGLRVEGQSFLARVRKKRLVVEESGLEKADCILAGRAQALAAVFSGSQTAKALALSGRLGLEGDEAAATKFVRFFCAP